MSQFGPARAADAGDGHSLLPPVEAVDQLDAEALLTLLTHGGALMERARARLVLLAVAKPVAEPADELLTAEEVAQLLNAADSKWVYRHQRQLGGVKLDGLLRFSRRRLLVYIERQSRRQS